jgi:hypothetical protein
MEGQNWAQPSVSLRGGNAIQEQPITHRAVGVTEPVSAWLYTMSFSKGFALSPSAHGQRTRLVAEEAAYAANRNNLIGGSNSRT